MIAKPHFDDYADNKGNSSSITSLNIATPHHRLKAISNNSRNDEDSLLIKELSQQLKKHRFIKKQSTSFQTA